MAFSHITIALTHKESFIDFTTGQRIIPRHLFFVRVVENSFLTQSTIINDGKRLEIIPVNEKNP